MRHVLALGSRWPLVAFLLGTPLAMLACGGTGPGDAGGSGGGVWSEDSPALPPPTTTAADAPTISRSPPYATVFTEYRHRSGVLVNAGDDFLLVDPHVVSVPGAVSLRLIFEEVRLGDGSRMLVRSPLTGEMQHFTAQEMERWGNTTGVFSGDVLEIQVTLAPHGSGSYAIYGAFEGVAPREYAESQCGGTDDRVASGDPRSGRLDNACTMWLEGSNNCAFSAGQCFSGLPSPLTFPHIVEFNVPLSNPDGSLNPAPVRDQYPIAAGTLNFVDNPANPSDHPDDWAVARLGPNNLGETAVSRQGVGFVAAPVTVGAGEVIAAGPIPASGVSSGDLGQSFTVSVAGLLRTIGLYPLGGARTGTLELYQGSGYGGTLLSTQPITTLGTGALETFTLPAPVLVAPGIHTFHVTLSGGTVVNGSSFDYYPGGFLFGGGGGAIPEWDISFVVTIGDGVRVTGYGKDTGTANQTLQTHAGPFGGAAGFVLSYRVDTEGGNSGSPVIEETTGNAIGIHTNAGCGDDGSGGVTGANSGTEIMYGPIQAAYASVCAQAAASISGPGPRTLECNDGAGGATTTLSFPVSDPLGGLVFVEFRVDGTVRGSDTVAGAGNADFTFTYPLGGPYVVVATATTAGGIQSSWTLEVTVVDTTPPTIVCPANLTFECDGTNVVTYPDPVFSDTCSVPTLVCVPPSGSVFPVGVTLVTCTATDGAGNSASCSFTVTVADTTPPDLAIHVARTLLWLPLNGLADIGLTATATDACGAVTTTVTVFSDEDHGAAPYAPDAVILGLAPNQRISLRAQRDPIVNNGRWYIVVVDAIDDAGNWRRDHRAVVVPYNLTTSQILAIRALANAQVAGIPSPASGLGPHVGPPAPAGAFTLLVTPFD